jgi:hypothetical protein
MHSVDAETKPPQDYIKPHSSETEPVFEPLTDDELGNLLAAVGNHENKALLLAAMQPGVTYSRGDLKSLFDGLQGSPPVWDFARVLPFQYCRDSLAPIGLVAKEIINQKYGIVGFYKTDYGDEIGQAVAGHLLQYSLYHPDISLQQIFGATRTNSERKARSPMMRFEVIGELLTRQQPVRLADLPADKEGGWSRVSQHIHDMEKQGLISVERNFSQVYGIKKEALANSQLHPGKSQLPTNMKQILAERLDITNDDLITAEKIRAELIERHPEYASDNERFRDQVRNTLWRFVRRGILEIKGEYTDEQRVRITLSKQQKKQLEDCLELLYDMQTLTPNFIKEGKNKAKEIITNRTAVRSLVEKARNNSPYVHHRSSDERHEVLKGILTVSAQTSNEIENGLLQRGISLSRTGINAILRSLLENGHAKREKIRGKTFWSIVEEQEREPDQQ